VSTATAAIDYIGVIGLEAAYATEALSDIPGVRIIGTAKRKAVSIP
jgi:hypothetical protein